MKKSEYNIVFHGTNKILCSVTHKKTKLSAWGVESNDPEVNKNTAIERLKKIIEDNQTSTNEPR